MSRSKPVRRLTPTQQALAAKNIAFAFYFAKRVCQESRDWDYVLSDCFLGICFAARAWKDPHPLKKYFAYRMRTTVSRGFAQRAGCNSAKLVSLEPNAIVHNFESQYDRHLARNLADKLDTAVAEVCETLSATKKNIFLADWAGQENARSLAEADGITVQAASGRLAGFYKAVAKKLGLPEDNARRRIKALQAYRESYLFCSESRDTSQH